MASGHWPVRGSASNGSQHGRPFLHIARGGVVVSALRGRTVLWHFLRFGILGPELVLCAHLSSNRCMPPALPLPARECSRSGVNDHSRPYISLADQPPTRCFYPSVLCHLPRPALEPLPRQPVQRHTFPGGLS